MLPSKQEAEVWVLVGRERWEALRESKGKLPVNIASSHQARPSASQLQLTRSFVTLD